MAAFPGDGHTPTAWSYASGHHGYVIERDEPAQQMYACRNTFTPYSERDGVPPNRVASRRKANKAARKARAKNRRG